MLNQFHDIVPGSAIHEVYRTSDVEYEEILRIGQAALDQALNVWTQFILHTDINGKLAANLATKTEVATQTGAQTDTQADTPVNTHAGIPYVVFNSLGWERGDWIEIRGGDELHGWAAFDEHGTGASLRYCCAGACRTRATGYLSTLCTLYRGTSQAGPDSFRCKMDHRRRVQHLRIPLR